MFTGIIETIGEITAVEPAGTGRVMWIRSSLSSFLKPDQSLSHSGVCLTVEAIGQGDHRVTAVEETLKKTTLGHWSPGDRVNLERGLELGARLDGHLVQGHVDSVALCTERKEGDGSWEFRFEYPRQFHRLIVEKGSICVDGVSLTAFEVKKRSFRVAVIPYTYSHTCMSELVPGKWVNVEFDLVGKYVLGARK